MKIYDEKKFKMVILVKRLLKLSHITPLYRGFGKALHHMAHLLISKLKIKNDLNIFKSI